MTDKFPRVILLLLLIARSKLVPDFALTIHFIHLIVTSLYTHSLPRNVLWWALQVASAALMTFGGIWACQWRELRPMAFGTSSTQNVESTAQQEADVEGEGHDMGGRRGRGRGRDGGGLYEMVGMK